MKSLIIIGSVLAILILSIGLYGYSYYNDPFPYFHVVVGLFLLSFNIRKVEENAGPIIVIFMMLLMLYYIFGMFGFLPNSFYEVCEDIDLDTAKRIGCCEDRPSSHPASWIFGARTCDKYRDSVDVNLEEIE